MKYVVETTKIEGLKILIPEVITDERGCFVQCFSEVDMGITFVQDNLFISKKNVLRGLHVQKEPQAKLVTVISGKVFDVAVDMRKDSKTYLEWCGVELSAENRKELFIPEGFAHGYYVLEDSTAVLVKLSSYWKAENEIGICWNDPMLNIQWPGVPILAEKDIKYDLLRG